MENSEVNTVSTSENKHFYQLSPEFGLFKNTLQFYRKKILLFWILTIATQLALSLISIILFAILSSIPNGLFNIFGLPPLIYLIVYGSMILNQVNFYFINIFDGINNVTANFSVPEQFVYIFTGIFLACIIFIYYSLIYLFLIFIYILFNKLRKKTYINIKTISELVIVSIPILTVISIFLVAEFHIPPQIKLLFYFGEYPSISKSTLNKLDENKYSLLTETPAGNTITSFIYKRDSFSPFDVSDIPVATTPTYAYDPYDPNTIYSYHFFKIENTFETPKEPGTYVIVSQSKVKNIVCKWDGYIYLTSNDKLSSTWVRYKYEKTNKKCTNLSMKAIIVPESGDVSITIPNQKTITPSIKPYAPHIITITPRPTTQPVFYEKKEYAFNVSVIDADLPNTRYSGERVVVYDSDNTIVCDKFTDNVGNILCDNLKPGTYTVHMKTIPGGYTVKDGNSRKITLREITSPTTKGIVGSVMFVLQKE